MFETTIAGSLPKPAWLAETDKLWPRWKLEGAPLAEAKRDATLLAIKAQEDAGIDIVGDGRNRHSCRPLQGAGTAGAGSAAPRGPRPCDGSTAGARPHQEEAEIHPARTDDDRRPRRRPRKTLTLRRSR